MLPVVLVVVLVFSLGALRSVPQTTMRSFLSLAGIQGSIMLPWTGPDQQPSEADRVSAAWQLNLRLDSALRRPGPSWLMFEGAKAGEGYELHWQTGSMSLQLFRAGDQVFARGDSGDEAFIVLRGKISIQLDLASPAVARGSPRPGS